MIHCREKSCITEGQRPTSYYTVEFKPPGGTYKCAVYRMYKRRLAKIIALTFDGAGYDVRVTKDTF